MTARITDLVPDGYAGYPVSGDSITAFCGVQQPLVDGLLWERAADAAPWPTAPDEAVLRGPRFDLYRESPLASGVIRAGVRVLIK